MNIPKSRTSNGTKRNGVGGASAKNNNNPDYNSSFKSDITDETYLMSLHGTVHTTSAYMGHSEPSIGSNGGSSQISLLNGNSSNGSQSTMNAFNTDDFDGYYSETPGVIELDDKKLIFQGEIGRVSIVDYSFAQIYIIIIVYVFDRDFTV
jgi:hypothetical protein